MGLPSRLLCRIAGPGVVGPVGPRRPGDREQAVRDRARCHGRGLPRVGDVGRPRGSAIGPRAWRLRVQPRGELVGGRRVLIAHDRDGDLPIGTWHQHGRSTGTHGPREEREQPREPVLGRAAGREDVERAREQGRFVVGGPVLRAAGCHAPFHERRRGRDDRRGRGCDGRTRRANRRPFLGHPGMVLGRSARRYPPTGCGSAGVGTGEREVPDVLRRVRSCERLRAPVARACAGRHP